jgi:hypothetical protein
MGKEPGHPIPLDFKTFLPFVISLSLQGLVVKKYSRKL